MIDIEKFRTSHRFPSYQQLSSQFPDLALSSAEYHVMYFYYAIRLLEYQCSSGKARHVGYTEKRLQDTLIRESLQRVIHARVMK
jgi:hypothetical protein